MFKFFGRDQVIPVDQEIELIRREKLLKMEEELQEVKAAYDKKVNEMAKMCADQLGEWEHDFHSTKEVKGIELARLETRAETYKEVNVLLKKAQEEVREVQKAVLRAREEEIARLQELLKLLPVETSLRVLNLPEEKTKKS